MWEAALAFLSKNSIPIFLASQALSTLFRSDANDKALAAQRQRMNEERVRQDQLRAKEEQLRVQLNVQREQDRATARKINEQAQQALGPEAQARARQEAEARANSELAPTTVAPEAAAFAQASEAAPREVNNEIARKFVDALETARQHARSASRLRSFGDARFAGDIGLGRAEQDVARTANSFGRTASLVNSQVGEIGNLKQFSNNVLGQELEAARLAGSSSRGISDLLGSAGDIALLYGLTRPKPKPPMPPAIPPVGSNFGVAPYLDIHRGYGPR